MIFIDNKYTNWYYQIIDSAKNRKLDTNLYVEKHHIIPKSLGGSKNKDFIIKVWELFDAGLNKRQISLKIGASYDRVRIAVDKREEILATGYTIQGVKDK